MLFFRLQADQQAPDEAAAGLRARSQAGHRQRPGGHGGEGVQGAAGVRVSPHARLPDRELQPLHEPVLQDGAVQQAGGRAAESVGRPVRGERLLQRRRRVPVVEGGVLPHAQDADQDGLRG